MLHGQPVCWLWTLPMARITGVGPTAQPMRQPVMAYDLLAPLTVITRSASPGRRAAKQVAFAAPNTKRS
jgi:hypothetical protein